MSPYNLSCASIAGRDHVAVRKGSQDSYVSGTHEGLTFAIVSDGCGSGPRSETGAHLTTTYLAESFYQCASKPLTLEDLVSEAMSSMVDWFADIAFKLSRANKERSQVFLRTHMLATVMGFVTRENNGLLFWCGDGLYALNDEIFIIDRDNKPDYPAYQVFQPERPLLSTRAFNVQTTNRIAIATDGLTKELIEKAWGHQGNDLQRWLFQRMREGHCADDSTLVIAEYTA